MSQTKKSCSVLAALSNADGPVGVEELYAESRYQNPRTFRDRLAELHAAGIVSVDRSSRSIALSGKDGHETDLLAGIGTEAPKPAGQTDPASSPPVEGELARLVVKKASTGTGRSYETDFVAVVCQRPSGHLSISRLKFSSDAGVVLPDRRSGLRLGGYWSNPTVLRAIAAAIEDAAVARTQGEAS